MAGLHGGQQAGAVIERKQHVVDRRAVSHGNISLDKEQKQQARRLPTKPLFPQLPPGPSCVTAEPKASDSCKIGPGTPGKRVYLAREASLFTSVICKDLETAAEAAILPGRLLKWAVRVGRRAVAAGIWDRLGDIFVSESKFSGDLFPVRSCDCLPRGALLRRRPVKVSNSLFRRGKSDCTAGRRRSRATEPGAEEKSLK